jgi:hypothetical protein
MQNARMGKEFDWDVLRDVEVQENILLAGAGFTRDFGGFLAEEMWTLIYNHPEVRACPKIASRMRNDFNYESVYHEILTGKEYGETERKAIQAAVSDAYMTLDEETRDSGEKSRPASLSGVQKMLSLFEGQQGRMGFFFTLNQDLFIERHCAVELPWAGPPALKGAWEFKKSEHSVMLPNDEDLKIRKAKNPLPRGGLCYVKLHGSMNWMDHNGRDIMVIGMGKDEQIGREPLLRLYSELFAMVLTKAKRLLVIGYGFGDEHVNNTMALAMAECQNPGLELYVVSPARPSLFMMNMTHKRTDGSDIVPFGRFLVEKLGGYFPCTLSQIFPSRGGKTLMWRMIRQGLFR